MKLWETILAKIKGPEVASLSFAKEGEEWMTHGVVMKVDDQQAIQLTSTQAFSSHSEVEKWLESVNKLPLVVSISSDEILTRKVESEELSKEQLLKMVVPQAQQDEFFLQELPIANGTFVSIVRKHVLNQILEIVPKTNQVVGLYLSPLVLTTLAKGLNQHQSSLAGFKIAIEAGEVNSIGHAEDNPETIELSENEYIQTEYVSCYSAGLTHILGVRMLSDFNDLSATEEYLHKSFLARYTPYVLGGLFAIFLINTFFYLQFSTENDLLVQGNSSLLALQKEVALDEAFVNEYQELLEGNNQSLFTRLADEIGYSIPPTLQLLKLELRPLYLEEKKPVDETLSLQIEGQADNAVAYANWIEKLKEYDWVEGIVENTYKQGAFQLKVIVKSRV